MIPFARQSWENQADVHRPQEVEGEWTGCWAQNSYGGWCNAANSDPIGLCPEHRAEIIGVRA